MIKKIFSNQSKTVTGAALVIGAASFVSRLIGVVRDRIFASQFGAGDVLDAYYAAFRIPDTVYNLLIVGALSAGFIPVFTKLLIQDKKKAWLVTNSIINIIAILLVIICGILFIFTPELTKVIVPGFEGEKLEKTILLTRIMFLSPILLGLSSIASGVLQSFKAFLTYALTPIMYNIGIIIGAIVLVPHFGEKGLAIGVVLGAILHLTIQLPALYANGFKYKRIIMWKDKDVREIGRLMIPRTLGLAVQQVNWIVITILASTLAAGSLTVFNFANNLQHFPIGIIGISFAIAAFPTLSRYVAEGKTDELRNQLTNSVKQILFFIIPISISILMLRAQIVRVVLGGEAFDWNATILTMNTLAFFSISLFAQCLTPLLARGFYALHNTWIPLVAGAVSAIVNIIASLILKDILGVMGLALAFSIAMTVQFFILWIILRIKLKTLNELIIFKSLFRILIAAGAMAITIQLFKEQISFYVNMTKFWGILLQGGIAGMAGLFVYGILSYILRIDEMKHLTASMKRRWLKLRNIQGEIGKADEI